MRSPRRLGVPAFTSLDACLRAVRPDFVLTATPWPVTPAVIAEAVDRGCRCWPRPRRRPISQAFARCGRRWAAPGWFRWPSST